MESLYPESIFIIEERARKDLRRSPSPFSYPKAGLMIHEVEFPRCGALVMHEPLKRECSSAAQSYSILGQIFSVPEILFAGDHLG